MAKSKLQIVMAENDEGEMEAQASESTIRRWHAEAAKLGGAQKKMELCFKELDLFYDREKLVAVTPRGLTYAEVWGALRCGLEELRELRAELEVRGRTELR